METTKHLTQSKWSMFFCVFQFIQFSSTANSFHFRACENVCPIDSVDTNETMAVSQWDTMSVFVCKRLSPIDCYGQFNIFDDFIVGIIVEQSVREFRVCNVQWSIFMTQM